MYHDTQVDLDQLVARIAMDCLCDHGAQIWSGMGEDLLLSLTDVLERYFRVLLRIKASVNDLKRPLKLNLMEIVWPTCHLLEARRKSRLYGGLLGQESGNAIVDVLYGDVNSSGKLIHTIAKNESDYPVGICESLECNFTEGVHIEYRYFAAQNQTVRYPFGHGLSYTTFKYSAIAAEKTDAQALSSTYPTGPLALGGNSDLFDEVISVSIELANSGNVDGAEVAQLYISYPDSAQQPVRQLRGFEKVLLSKGESQKVTFSVRRRGVSHWDVVAQKWAIAKGTYTFAVESCSRDLRVKTTLEI